MKIVSLKETQSSKEKETEALPAVDESVYPWGLCLWLDQDLIKKLGFKSVSDFTLGQVLDLVGKAKVTGISMREREGGENTQCVDLQITDMGLGAERQTVGDKLYAK